MQLPVGADYQLSYTINDSLQIMATADYRPLQADIPLMPKFGMRMAVAPADSFRTVTWYGRGPEENYPDRQRSQAIGEYQRPHGMNAGGIKPIRRHVIRYISQHDK